MVSIDEFWKAVSPIEGRFGNSSSNFVFRGQSDAGWDLVPKAYRPDVIARYKLGLMAAMRDHPGQVFFEWSLLHAFIYYCDSAGLAIPNDSVEFRAYFDNISRFSTTFAIHTKDWPQDEVVGLMALAQHHGVPTRLLDWCARPYVACYFAAASAVLVGVDGAKRLAVFALDLGTTRSIALGIRHVKVPGSTSANLAVQGGSFTLVENSGYRGDDFTPNVSVESRLAGTPVSLIKFTLPQLLAPQLLDRCEKFGVTAATVFPGFDGAGRAVLESTLAWAHLAAASGR